MGYTTYENTAEPHVAIHVDDCGHLRKHGGVGKAVTYHEFATLDEARRHAKSTGLPIRECSFCMKEKQE